MFEALTEKLTGVLNRLSNRGRLTEKELDEALREVRLALLEADVNFRVVRDFVARIKGKALGAEVLQSLTPGQQVVKIVHQELTAVLGPGGQLLRSPQPPSVVLLVGLQGSGKTTTTAKLARLLKNQGQGSLLVAADVRRPAAQEQLAILASQLSLPVASGDAAVKDLCLKALHQAQEQRLPWLLVDTAGRLHIEDALMEELAQLKEALHPSEVLLVVDGMTDQDAVRVAQDFQGRVDITGLVLTKMEGDARGGAALSITSVTGVPIKFLGTGEKLDALEPFHPDRLASRILGMGDVLTLIERAQVTYEEQKVRDLEKKLRQASFNLEDLLEQFRQLKKMGPLEQVLGLIPGFSQLSRRLPQAGMEEGKLKKAEAIILSMTLEERRNPQVINGSRRRRIARGSGTTLQDINQLLNQFSQMQRLMKQLASGKGRLPFLP